MYVMNTDNNERFGLGRVATLHANPDGNRLHALVDITPSLAECTGEGVASWTE